MYGKRKPIALRRPLSVSRCKKTGAQKVNDLSPLLSPAEDRADQLSTPTVTEGESATDTELDTECEGEATPKDKKRELDNISTSTSDSFQPTTSQHDLLHKYFRRDVVGLYNIDLLRQVTEFGGDTYLNSFLVLRMPCLRF